VGQKRSNDLGLFDVHGNVWTWCQDGAFFYPQATAGHPAEDKEDIRTISDDQGRVLRGGSFGNPAPNLLSAGRNGNRPTDRSGVIGLRVCRTYYSHSIHQSIKGKNRGR
jgi:formylglycine-generating enzyme required for sulfatase activity